MVTRNEILAKLAAAMAVHNAQRPTVQYPALSVATLEQMSPASLVEFEMRFCGGRVT